MEVALCHPSGVWNIEVASRFLENFCLPVLWSYVCSHW